LLVLDGCETRFVKLREEYRLAVFDIGVMRKIFGPEREKGT